MSDVSVLVNFVLYWHILTLYVSALFKINIKEGLLATQEAKTWVLGVPSTTTSYLIILQMNFALTMTSDRLMGSVDPSSQASESVASLSVVCRQLRKA